MGAGFELGRSPWSLRIGLRYLRTDLRYSDRESGESASAGLNPVSAMVGFGYRF